MSIPCDLSDVSGKTFEILSWMVNETMLWFCEWQYHGPCYHISINYPHLRLYFECSFATLNPINLLYSCFLIHDVFFNLIIHKLSRVFNPSALRELIWMLISSHVLFSARSRVLSKVLKFGFVSWKFFPLKVSPKFFFIPFLAFWKFSPTKQCLVRLNSDTKTKWFI